MNYILFDGTVRNALLPFTFTRPVADIRIGILTIREKWETQLGTTTTTLTEEYLSDKFPMVEMEENVMINAAFVPNHQLVALVQNLKSNQALFAGDEVIAFYTNDTQEEIDLYGTYRRYEDAQSTAKTTYKRTRDTIIVRDTITRVDVVRLVNSCDSVIASDSLVIDNLKEQINIKDEKTNNLQEVVGAYKQKTVLLSEEINNLNENKKKLEKQKKRRTGALVVASSVAILSTFVLSILL